MRYTRHVKKKKEKKTKSKEDRRDQPIEATDDWIFEGVGGLLGIFCYLSVNE